MPKHGMPNFEGKLIIVSYFLVKPENVDAK